MMDRLNGYVLCIGACAILIGILSELSNPKSGAGAVFRISAGLFLILQILLPVSDLHPESWMDYFDRIMAQGEAESCLGTDYASNEMAGIITDRTRAYILDKAQAYRADLSVEVELDDSRIPVPVAVTVSGQISPYGKNAIQKIIASDLGIPKERQLWIGN